MGWKSTTPQKQKSLFLLSFSPERFWQCLLGTKLIVYFDHKAIKHLLSKKDLKPSLIRWILSYSYYKSLILKLKTKVGKITWLQTIWVILSHPKIQHQYVKPSLMNICLLQNSYHGMQILWIILSQTNSLPISPIGKKSQNKKGSRKVCIVWALPMEILCEPSHLKVCCTKWGKIYYCFLSLLCMWGTFWSPKNHKNDFGQRALLATHIPDSYSFRAN